MRKHRDIKLVTTEKRRNYLVSEPNYHTTKFYTEKWLSIEMKDSIILNKPVYSGLTISDVNEICNVWMSAQLHKTKI